MAKFVELNLFYLARLQSLQWGAKQTSHKLARRLFSSSLYLDSVETVNLRLKKEDFGK